MHNLHGYGKGPYSIALYSVLLLISANCFGQTSPYQKNIRIADSLYTKGQYKSSAEHFSRAFESLGWKGTLEDRFRAARSWSMINKADSAFHNLFAISERLLYSDVTALENEPAFRNIRPDPRWQSLTSLVETNAIRKVAFKKIKDSLEAIFQVDQAERTVLEDIYKKKGIESPEFKSKIPEIRRTDSLHTLYVSEILDRYGWLGEIEIGRKASTALLVVILHSKKETQIKYLPVIRSAFNNKKIGPHNYSLLEDKINLAKSGYQIYGTQFGINENGKKFVYPIKDKDQVNQLRKEIGLGPLEDYLKSNGIDTY